MEEKVVNAVLTEPKPFDGATPEGPTSSGRLLEVVALVSFLKQFRECLTDPDMKSAPTQGISAVRMAVVEIAQTAGSLGITSNDGLCASFDGQVLELIVDYRKTHRRLEVEYDPATTRYRVSRVNLHGAVITPWMHRPYALAQHVKWLLGFDAQGK